MSSSYYSNVPISLFPLDNYNQQVNNWINPSMADYHKPLLSNEYQKDRAAEFYARNFGSLSAWSPEHVQSLLDQSPSIKTLEKQYISMYDNINKDSNELGYDENFRLHSEKWIQAIASNMCIEQLAPPLHFNSASRGICINNIDIRALPTADVHFYNFTLPGQGYPFDNLQVSCAWAGTATYTVAKTIDKAWSLVITHFGTGWVKSEYIAKVDESFLRMWQNYAEINLAAITQTKIPMIDEYGIFRFSAYIGAVFPLFSKGTSIQILIPVADTANLATINKVALSIDQAAIIPLAATPHNFSILMQELVERPYGWGNLYLFNDCSAELKSLYTPFGIWLARHSSDQASAGKIVDKSGASLEERIDYLINFGHKLMTIVYIGGHVFLYVGNYLDDKNSENMAMSYQNVWGLSPADHSYRQVIGGAVFLPISKSYPENLDLSSLADKTYFILSYLDEWPAQQNDSISLIKTSKSLENVF